MKTKRVREPHHEGNENQHNHKKKAQKKEEAGAQREEALEVRRGFTVSHRLKVSDKDRT